MTRRSREIERAVIADAEGDPLAASAGTAAARLARLGGELVSSGGRVRPGAEVERVEVALRSGSVFAVRLGGLVAVATTTPEPASALVLHDLRACLAQVSARAGAASEGADA
jgi:hypothetical protein